MSRPKIRQLLDELLKQTKADTISWEPVESQKDSYKASFPGTSLIVSRWSALRNSSCAMVTDLSKSFSVDINTYRLELLEGDDQTVETLLTVPGQSAYRALRETFNLAGQQASQADKSIDRVLGHLRGI